MSKINKVVLATIGILAVVGTTLAVASAGSFSDVNDSDIYAKGIGFLSTKGIVNGNPDGTFAPEKTLNRAEMLKIVAEGHCKSMREAGNNNLTSDQIEKTFCSFDSYIGKQCFSDVPSDAWYTKYVCYAKDKGWVQGYAGNTFKPTQDVTFVEGLKIMAKGFGSSYNEVSDPWYKDLVDVAGEVNFIPPSITGFNKGLKRGEMADMISRKIIFNKDNSKTDLNDYLGKWANVKVTYDTISAGEDLSKVADTMADNKENLSSFLADASCLVAKNNGSIPDAEAQKVNDKYAYGDEVVLFKAIEAPGEDVRTMAISKINAQCKEDFVKAKTEPGIFLDAFVIGLQNAASKAMDTMRISSLLQIEKVLITKNLDGKPYPIKSGPITESLAYDGYGGTNTWAELKSEFPSETFPSDPTSGQHFYFVNAPTGYSFGLFALMEVAKNANAVCTIGANPTITMGTTTSNFDTNKLCYAILVQ